MQHDVSLLNKGYQEINPLTCGWEDCENGHAFGPASREYYLLHYIISGSGIFQRNGQNHSLSKGSMFLIRPYELTFYKADDNDPWEYIWIGFTGQLVPELLEHSGFSDNNCTLCNPSLRNTFLSMKEAVNLPHSAEIFLCSKIFEFFSNLHEEFNPELTGTTGSLYSKRAKDHIMANYANHISVESIANMLGIDRRYLCRVFHKNTGDTPQNFLVNYRLEKAAVLLDKHGYSVSEAARSTGYEDIYNFSKMFKKKYGVPPSRYLGKA
ncbi:MAG TPA: AraC family transcriptional regulator [Ruminiclostridium sp.]